ncbi:fungal-specific transcription factor domain-containing protein [Lentinula raphanica]|nr:fungal-specific transcription factor domain-containing protein [Lentinula raphanica]
MSFKHESFLHSFPQMSTKEMHDMKRVKGQISCAECRRLKLKCDKKIPCSSCVRRGCKSVCPTETSLAQGKRSAESTGLLQQVETMSQRIQQLEEAISTLQASVSTTQPLSANVHQNLSDPNPSSLELRRTVSAPESSETVDALGTLAVDIRGDARYLGPSAGLESLLEDGSKVKEETDTEDDYFSLPSDEISQLPKYFPLTSGNKWDVEPCLEMILSFLPSKERAWTLAEIFIEHSLLQVKVVSREELFEELLAPIYRDTPTTEYSTPKCPLSPTRLSVLLLCLAHGSLADVSQPMYSPESDDYLNLSRICLALHPILIYPDLASVQALTLIGMFYDTGGRSYNIEAAWSFLTIAAKLSQSLGLHRESPRWGLDQRTLHRRRTVFWEILTWDAMLSLSLGRPPCFFGAHIDTPLPVDEDFSVDEKGNIESGFHHWRMSFSRDVVTAVSNITLSSKMPDYPTILDLDRRLREHPLPTKYDPLRFLYSALEKHSPKSVDDSDEEQHGYESTSVILKGHHLTHWRALVTMFIHRAFFAQALLQSPSNPLDSVYAPSFLATYRAASTLVHSNVKHFYKYAPILSRFWALWNGILSAGIILGLIVTRCPKIALAANAYEELGLVVELFRMGASDSDRAKRGLYVLFQIYDKATKAYKSQDHSMREELNVAQEDADALHTLEIFAGYTKLLMKDMASNSKAFPNRDSGTAEGKYQPKEPAGPIRESSSTNPAPASSHTPDEYLNYPSQIKNPYPIIHPINEIPQPQSSVHHIQTLDHTSSEQPHYNFVPPSSHIPNMHSFKRQAVDSAKVPVTYAVDAYSTVPQHSDDWLRYYNPAASNLKNEDQLDFSNLFSDPRYTYQGSPVAENFSSQHLLTTAVGAMNAQWEELMQREGVNFPTDVATRGYQ